MQARGAGRWERLHAFILGLGVDGERLTARRVERYCEAGLLAEPLDVFTLTLQAPERLARVELDLGPEALPPGNIQDAIAAALPVSLARFLAALEIPGATAAEIRGIAARAGSLPGLLASLEVGAAASPTAGDAPPRSGVLEHLSTARHRAKLAEILARAPWAIAPVTAVNGEYRSRP